MTSRRPASRETDGRRLRWQAHRQARRQALIDAAIRAVHHHGADAGMDQIAAEAGTSKPVVYRYFTDKADLYLAVGQQVAQVLVRRITAAVDAHASAAGASAAGVEAGRAMVAAGVEAYLRSIEDEPALYRFVVHHTLLDRPAASDLVADYSSLLGSYLARRLGELMRELGQDPGAAEPWGYGVVGLVRSAGEWWLEQRTMTRQALTEHLTALIWTGLAGAYATLPAGDPGADGIRALPG